MIPPIKVRTVHQNSKPSEPCFPKVYIFPQDEQVFTGSVVTAEVGVIVLSLSPLRAGWNTGDADEETLAPHLVQKFASGGSSAPQLGQDTKPVTSDVATQSFS